MVVDQRAVDVGKTVVVAGLFKHEPHWEGEEAGEEGAGQSKDPGVVEVGMLQEEERPDNGEVPLQGQGDGEVDADVHEGPSEGKKVRQYHRPNVGSA